MAVTMQQIADACGVSRGTVDRALREREGVRPEVAQRIRDKAREMGYIPKHTVLIQGAQPARIGVVMHSGTAPIMQQISEKIRRFPKEAMLPVEPIVRIMDGTNIAHQLALIDEMVQNEQIDGLALMPLASTQVRDKINELIETRGLPIVTFNTDIPDCGRMAYVGPDNIASGRAAAALMGMITGGDGRILPILGQQSGHFADSQRMSGFLSETSESFAHMQLLPVEYCYLDEELAERIALRALRDMEDISGIYLTSVGRIGVERAIRQMGCAGRVHVVMHDITPDNMRMIREGVVDFVIGQDWQTQGSLPLRLLYQYLTQRKMPEKRIYTTEIGIKFRCNLTE